MKRLLILPAALAAFAVGCGETTTVAPKTEPKTMLQIIESACSPGDKPVDVESIPGYKGTGIGFYVVCGSGEVKEIRYR